MEGGGASSWSVEQLQRWLLNDSGLELGLATELAAQLLAEEVDGEALLEYARDDLKKDLGLPGGKVTKLWKAIATLRPADPAEGEAAQPEPEDADASHLAEHEPPPKKMALLVRHLPTLDDACWRAVVRAAREGPPSGEAPSAELATMLCGCGLVDVEVQRTVVQQCAFLLGQFARAGSARALRKRLIPLGFSEAHIAALGFDGSGPEVAAAGSDGSAMAAGSPVSPTASAGSEDLDDWGDEDEDEDEDGGLDDGMWRIEMLTRVRKPELKSLLRATAQHMLRSDLQNEDLESVEEACALAKVPLRHTPVLTKVLSAAIIDAARSARTASGKHSHEPGQPAEIQADAQKQGTSAGSDGDSAPPYPLGDGHAALIASAAKWYVKQLRRREQQEEQEEAQSETETPEGQEAVSSSSGGGGSRSSRVGWPYGCKMAGWLTLVGDLPAQIRGDSDQPENGEYRDSGEGTNSGEPDLSDARATGARSVDGRGQEQHLRRWFVLRQTCIEVFASAQAAERGDRGSAEYSAVPIPFVALLLRSGRSTGRKSRGGAEPDSEFDLRFLNLQMVLGNPLPKTLTVDAGDSSTRDRWVQCLEAEVLGEAVQGLRVAAHAAAGAAAGLGGIAAGGGSKGLAAAVAAKDKAKQKAQAASEAAQLLKEQVEEERQRKKAEDDARRAEELALARENDAKRRAALEDILLADAWKHEEYYLYMRHFFMSRRRGVAKERRIADYRAGRLEAVKEIFGGLDAGKWAEAWEADLEQQAEEEEDPLAVLDELFEASTDTAGDEAGSEDLFPDETDSDEDSSDEDDRPESSEEEPDTSEEESASDGEDVTIREKEASAHVQFRGKGGFTAVTMRLEGEVLRLIQCKEGAGTDSVPKEWSPNITACSVGAPKKLRSAKGRNAAPTVHQLRLDLASGVQDGSGNKKYIICVSSALEAEEWKRALEPAHTSEYRLFTVEQHHLRHKTAPKVVSLGVNRDGMALMDPATQRVFDRYRFSKVRGWKSDSQKLYLRVTVDTEYHSLGSPAAPNKPIDFWLGTTRGSEVCDLLKSIAFTIDAIQKRERWRSDATASGQPTKIEVARCQFGGKGKFEPITLELAGDRLVMETHQGAVTRLTVAKRIATAKFSKPKKVQLDTASRY